jgi:hypothetical protein
MDMESPLRRASASISQTLFCTEPLLIITDGFGGLVWRRCKTQFQEPRAMAERDRYQAGVMAFAQRGYGNPDDPRLDSDDLVDAIEAAAAVAGESSTAIGTLVWTDRLTAYTRHRARAYRATGTHGAADKYLRCISYTIDLLNISLHRPSRAHAPRGRGVCG